MTTKNDDWVIESAAEMMTRFEAEDAAARDKVKGDCGRLHLTDTRWGGWQLCRKDRILQHQCGYEIDLDRCMTSAEVLDWIFQIDGKVWGQKSMPGLLEIMRVTLAPQSTLCSFGRDTPRTRREQDARIAALYKSWPKDYS